MLRREILKLLAAFAASRSFAAGSSTPSLFEYSAKATVLVLAVPLVSRERVGSAFLRMQERGLGSNTQVDLAFGAGSHPDRAAGLNRLGFFEESVVESNGEILSASYFGFMTASAEASVDQARAALRQNGPPAITAIRGRIRGHRIWNRLLRVSGLPNIRWPEHRTLAEEIGRRLENASGGDAEIALPSEQAPGTFLHAMRCILRSAEPKQTRFFVHNGELLRLDTVRKPDPGQGAVFLKRGVASSAAVHSIAGKISHGGGKAVSEFKLWCEDGSQPCAPLRFEFRPRSFLRLAFERIRTS